MGRLVGDLRERTLGFGADVVSAVERIPNRTTGWVVGRQLVRAGTSIGANVWEANAAFSDADFASKISIAHKEATETQYWLQLARRTKLIDEEEFQRLNAEADEQNKILGTILKKTREYLGDRR